MECQASELLLHFTARSQSAWWLCLWPLQDAMHQTSLAALSHMLRLLLLQLNGFWQIHGSSQMTAQKISASTEELSWESNLCPCFLQQKWLCSIDPWRKVNALSFMRFLGMTSFYAPSNDSFHIYCFFEPNPSFRWLLHQNIWHSGPTKIAACWICRAEEKILISVEEIP